MEIKEITKSFNYTVYTILHAKLRNFIKKSIWKYMLASLLIAYGLNSYLNNGKGSLVNNFLIVFVSIILLSVTLMFISSYVLYLNKRQDSMDITFKESEIEVFWKFKGIKERKNWDWIKGFEEVNNIYYFDLDVWPKNVVMMGKQRLSQDENDVLYDWLQKNRKIKTNSR